MGGIDYEKILFNGSPIICFVLGFIFSMPWSRMRLRQIAALIAAAIIVLLAMTLTFMSAFGEYYIAGTWTVKLSTCGIFLAFGIFMREEAAKFKFAGFLVVNKAECDTHNPNCPVHH